jgi:signal transduction histidine kinase
MQLLFSLNFLQLIGLCRAHARWLLGICFLTLMSVSAGGQASQTQTLIVSSAWWQDQNGQATLQEAQAQTYTPYEGMFNRGYSDTTHWLRLTLAASEQPIGLRMTPPWIDEITLYDSASPEQVFKAGDNHPKGRNVQKSLGYTFTLPASPHPRDVWIKLTSTSTHHLTVVALPIDQMLAKNTLTAVWTSLYAAMILWILLALLSVWWIRREHVLGVYLVRHSVTTAYCLFYLGLPGLLLPTDILPPATLDKIFSLLVIIYGPTGLWFDITLLKTYRPQRHVLFGLKVVTVISLLPLGLMIFGKTRLALESTVMSLLLVTAMLFVTALSTRPETSVERLMPKKVMLCYYSLVLGSVLIGLFSLLGLIQGPSWTQHMLIVHGLVSGLAMTIILFVRGQRLHRQHQQTALQLKKAQQDMDLEQRRNHEQSQFLHMLMHELKTPLSVVSAALGTKSNREENLTHAGRAVQDMKAIIDRCVQADQMGELTLRQHRNTVELPTWVAKLAGDIPRLGARLQLQAHIAIPLVHIDQQLLQIVLTNLLDNASRYSDPITLVTIELAPTHHRNQAGVQVRVRNTPGIAGWPDERQVFNKYYRASGAQRDSGSGLGLYLSRQLAHSLGGTLDYAPTSQHVEFVLWIPITPA